ncbi:MAG: M60 family metallopeptidase [Clostridium sp.]|nr:M60 family metallopeptidase [Clostridium sp.]
MKHFTQWRLLACVLLTLPFVAVDVRAQLSTLVQGKVYQFINRANGLAMGTTSLTEVKGLAADASEYAQLWQVTSVTDGKYTMRNLGNGNYLKGNGTSAVWTTVASTSETNGLYLQVVGGTYNTLSLTNNTSGYDNAHYAASQSGKIVGWETSAHATQWTINQVNLTEEELNANWEELSELNVTEAMRVAWQTALGNLFADKACTVLKKSFANEAVLTADTDYKALPSTLQQMVRKVWGGDWTEANYDSSKKGWDSDYARKFRVQLYEPYSEPEAAAKALGLKAHTNLNNPTGLFANNRSVLYIMVEGPLKGGSSLYLAAYSGHGKLSGYGTGIALREGLNVVPYLTDDNNLCINYVVHTFDTSKGKGNKAKARRLSEHGNVKIHIEGGYINGYWNRMGDDLYTPDTNADWDYYEERATRTDLTVLGKYMTLQFPLRDADAGGQKGLASFFNEQVNVEATIAEWDNIMLWERLLLGIMSEADVDEANGKWKSYYPAPHSIYTYTGNDTDGYGSDYSDYYRVHGLAYGVNSGHMYAGWDHTGYNFTTMGGIIRDLTTSGGSHWGPAHEIGHQHQGVFTMRGETEVTNNLFSNVVLWNFGQTTSRMNGTGGALATALADFYAGKPFCSYNIWALTHMYYKLFLYYHVLGENTKFYPRLFEMLRQDPLNGMGAKVDGDEAMLKFYRYTCAAAGEDLTEFFRAYGFLRPLTNYSQGDYGTSVYNMTQAQVDAAVAEIKSKGYKENLAVLFINDCTGEDIIGSKGVTLNHYDVSGGRKLINADLGNYATFGNNAPADYTCTMNGSTMVMNGQGGVGFMICNVVGEVIGFSDRLTFPLSSAVVESILQGDFEVKAVNADNTLGHVDYDKDDLRRAVLAVAMAEAGEQLAMKNDNQPGCYKSSAVAVLEAALTQAQGVYDRREGDKYVQSYNLLKQEVKNLKAATGTRVEMRPGTYVLRNKLYPSVVMAVNSGKALIGADAADTDDRKWTFEATGTKDVYYIRNVASKTYLGALTRSTQISAVATDSTDARVCGYKVTDMGDGTLVAECQDDNAQALHCNSTKKIVGWGTSDGSRWFFVPVTVTAESVQTRSAARTSRMGEVLQESEPDGGKAAEQIYDLQGRRLEQITRPGLYIVNGQKRYVSMP